MAVRLEPEVRENPTTTDQPAASAAEAAADRAWRAVLVSPRPPLSEAAVLFGDEPEDRLRTARGILFGLAISAAAWACAGLIWWAV